MEVECKKIEVMQSLDSEKLEAQKGQGLFMQAKLVEDGWYRVMDNLLMYTILLEARASLCEGMLGPFCKSLLHAGFMDPMVPIDPTLGMLRPGLMGALFI